MPLITLSQLKSYLQILDTDTSDDVFLNLLITSTQAISETYCHRKFDVTSYVGEQHLINHKIFPQNYPIVSVQKLVRFEASIGVIPDTSNVGSYRIFPNYIDLVDFKYVTMSGKLKYANEEESYAVIDYTAGYTVPPADLTLAALKLATLEYKDSRESRLGVEAESEGQLRYTYSKKDSEMPLNISAVLDRYKKVGL